jgi:mannitol-specific phosphotransferase system IIBC component
VCKLEKTKSSLVEVTSRAIQSLHAESDLIIIYCSNLDRIASHVTCAMGSVGDFLWTSIPARVADSNANDT